MKNLFKINSSKEFNYSFSTLFTRVLFMLFCVSGAQFVSAQTNLQSHQTINYDANNRVKEYTIPSGISRIQFTLKGGSGGNGEHLRGIGCHPDDDRRTRFGGDGALMSVAFPVGTGNESTHLAVGGKLRVVVGNKGDNARDGCGGVTAGGGGGSSGIAYLPPGKADNSAYWYTLAVAGAGSGGGWWTGFNNHGQGGRSTQSGDTEARSSHGTLTGSVISPRAIGGGVFNHRTYDHASFYHGGAVPSGMGQGFDGSYSAIRGTPRTLPGTGRIKGGCSRCEPGGNGFTGGAGGDSRAGEGIAGGGGGYSSGFYNSGGGSWYSYHFGGSGNVQAGSGRPTGAGYIEIRTVAGGAISLGQEWAPGATLGGRLVFQQNGDLVLRGGNNELLFVSGTHDRGRRLLLQADGNLVIYDANNHPIWNTGTHGKGADLVIRGYSFFIRDANGHTVWSTDDAIVDYVTKGTTLHKGNTLLEAGEYRLRFNNDGGLYIFRGDSDIVWRSGSHNKGADRASLNNDGGLWVFGDNNSVIWKSNSHNKGVHYFGLMYTGKAVFMDANGGVVQTLNP